MSMTTYIKEDLTVRLQAGQLPPVALTLHSLAEHYQVSFTPVRAALAELVEEGLLHKGTNRRLAASPEARPNRRKKLLPLPTPPRDAFAAIANDMVQLSLQGESIYLREEATAEKYEMSRSAIRNIFHRLAGAGMLDHIPRHGWRLRPFRREDLQAFIEVREVLELKALDLARSHLEVDRLQALLNGNILPTSAAELPVVDNNLHAYIIARAGNSYIQDFFERQGRYYELLFHWEDQDRATAIETVRQHREILQALLQKNWRTARKALSHHIRFNHPILSRIQPKTDPAEKRLARSQK